MDNSILEIKFVKHCAYNLFIKELYYYHIANDIYRTKDKINCEYWSTLTTDELEQWILKATVDIKNYPEIYESIYNGSLLSER